MINPETIFTDRNRVFKLFLGINIAGFVIYVATRVTCLLCLGLKGINLDNESSTSAVVEPVDPFLPS